MRKNFLKVIAKSLECVKNNRIDVFRKKNNHQTVDDKSLKEFLEFAASQGMNTERQKLPKMTLRPREKNASMFKVSSQPSLSNLSLFSDNNRLNLQIQKSSRSSSAEKSGKGREKQTTNTSVTDEPFFSIQSDDLKRRPQKKPHKVPNLDIKQYLQTMPSPKNVKQKVQTEERRGVETLPSEHRITGRGRVSFHDLNESKKNIHELRKSNLKRAIFENFNDHYALDRHDKLNMLKKRT
jgi:hypothetical protein